MQVPARAAALLRRRLLGLVHVAGPAADQRLRHAAVRPDHLSRCGEDKTEAFFVSFRIVRCFVFVNKGFVCQDRRF